MFLIRKIRKEKGYSLEGLAMLSGIASPHLSELETNKTNPTYKKLAKVARALRVQVGDLCAPIDYEAEGTKNDPE